MGRSGRSCICPGLCFLQEFARAVAEELVEADLDLECSVTVLGGKGVGRRWEMKGMVSSGEEAERTLPRLTFLKPSVWRISS